MTEHERWLKDNARENCFKYNLNSNSLYVDFGAFDGSFANEYSKRFGCNIIAFEPLPEFYEKAKNTLKTQKVVNVGVGTSNKIISVKNEFDGTSLMKEDGNIKVTIRDVVEIFNEIDHVDLLKINIEGFEYDVIDRMSDHKLLSRIDNILVQFHNFPHVNDVENRFKNTRNNLSITHNCDWSYKYVWESWSKK